MQQITNIIQKMRDFVKPFLHTFSPGSQFFLNFFFLAESYDVLRAFWIETARTMLPGIRCTGRRKTPQSEGSAGY